jgi:uncharacterized protein (TIGR03089 family)
VTVAESSARTAAATPYAALRAVRDLSSPFLTWYDDTSGARVELSMASLGNSIAKAAGHLRDELDIEPGDAVYLDLPVHWQRALWLGACWSARAVACISPASAAGARAAVTHRPDWLREQFADAAPDVTEVSLAPLWLPAREQPDVFTPVDVQQSDDPALLLADRRVLTAGEVMVHAADLADAWRLTAGGRLLAIDPVADPRAADPAHALGDAVGWLVALGVPLAATASVVLVANEDPVGRDQRMAAERATAFAPPA